MPRLEVTDDNRDRIGVVIGTGIGGISTLFDQIKLFLERGPVPGQSLPGANDAPDTGRRYGRDRPGRARTEYGCRDCLRLRNKCHWRSI